MELGEEEKEGQEPKRGFRDIELRRALFILPNAFTLASVFCGLYAILHGASGNGAGALYRSALAVFFAGFFDLFDGRVARLTKTQSEFGVQLDSLADIVSFGVAPAIIVYKWALWPLGSIGMIGAFCFTACGAIRLARFNLMATRSKSAGKFFVGLPIPLAAFMIIALVMAHYRLFGDLPVERHIPVLVLVLLLSMLMVSTIPYWSFKEFHFSLKSALWLFVLGLMIWFVWLRYPLSVAFVIAIGTYVLLGLGRALVRVISGKPLTET